jgi:hypothetical protein
MRKAVILSIAFALLGSLVPQASQAAGKEKAKPKSASSQTRAELSETGLWIGAYSGLDFALLGDIQDGLKDWEGVFEDNGGTGNTSVGRTGFLSGLEIGIPLDPDNAFALNGEMTLFRSQSTLNDYSGGSENGTLVVQPQVLGLTLNYLLRLGGEGKGGTFLQGGVGFYAGSTEVQASETLVLDTQYGLSLAGETIGGTLGLAQEFDLGDGVGLRLGVKGRLASIAKLTSRRIEVMGTVDTSTEFALARDGRGDPDYRLLGPLPTALIEADPDVEYATMDLSGFQATLDLRVDL